MHICIGGDFHSILRLPMLHSFHKKLQSQQSTSIVGRHPLLAPEKAAHLREYLGTRFKSEVQWAYEQQELQVGASSFFSIVFK
jgi:hypothetical protein